MITIKKADTLPTGVTMPAPGNDPASPGGAVVTIPARGNLPQWLRRIEYLRRARAAHFFLVHFNITDYVFDGNRPPVRMSDYLLRYFEECGCVRVGVLSLSRGLQ